MRAAGLLVFCAGATLAARSALLLAGRGRPRRGPVPALVIAGPYLRHRNPLLAGALLAGAGLALLAGTPSALPLVGALGVAAHLWVVRVEEPRLRARFGPAWAAYERRVPRWVPRTPPRD
jgi:protein-S-isoprenylcysteine O-methyltransferase Ste14